MSQDVTPDMSPHPPWDQAGYRAGGIQKTSIDHLDEGTIIPASFHLSGGCHGYIHEKYKPKQRDLHPCV